MGTIQVIGILFIVLLAGMILFCAATFLVERFTKKKISLRFLFKDFRQKMWMTVGLGILFSCLYFLIIFTLFWIKDSQVQQNLFSLLYRYPERFIYLGLLFFSCITVGIYLARMVIKHLYNRKY